MTPGQRLQRIVDEGKCIGCGLCASMHPQKLEMAAGGGGYLRPREHRALDDAEIADIYRWCPGLSHVGLPDTLMDPGATLDPMWGPWLRIDRIHAADPGIRYEGATGGALTALAVYLIESDTVDRVMHVAAHGSEPAFGAAVISSSRTQAVRGAGSRYGQAAALARFRQMLDDAVPFAVICKPCDASAIRQLAITDPRVNTLVTHVLTMVCGGLMPPFGIDAFLRRCGVDPQDVVSMRYRGQGCPGPTRVVLRRGEIIEKTYTDFWGTDPSMWHLPWRCKICPDGMSEAADLTSMDTWPGGSPTEEAMRTDPGTNAVVARTRAGSALLERAIDAGYLVREGGATVTELNDWQPHQVRKKIACEARYDGLAAEGHLRIGTDRLRTEALRRRLSADMDADAVTGTRRRIAIGKHRDDFLPAG